ncbi:MAG TPA: GDSL-type esterase/lipase family protein [Saprospiraceae bacterium]|nr:GDSL-type esterase/lipase family protein [Saprospiraceae bacterium]HND88650.1 GDSL-type esterase/lipase family protein [Saprospiraceae bacterium]
MRHFIPPCARRRRSAIALAGFLFCFVQCQSQFRPPEVEITEADTVGYGFIRQDDNVIQQPQHLAPVLAKLYEQRVRGGKKINIVHIGDSHILGNFLTREVRERLQRAFGDAGRGLIFPYKLAGSNGPKDYLVETNARWNGSNCQRDLDEKTPYGVSGFSLETSNSKAELTFRMRDTATSETRLFTKVTVLQYKTPGEYDLEVRDEVTQQTAQLFIEGDYARSYYFDRPVGQMTLSAKRTNGQQKVLSLDGISLENELSGVIYHSIGVNGAKFQDWVRAEYFARQVAELQPDLIILSMGTNEAQGRTDADYLYRTMRNLTAALADQYPSACFMLTTPADSYLRGKGLNPNMPDVSAVIRKFARDKGYALWDMFNFTGGENSAASWKSTGLLSADSVHYSKLGYAVQGKLMYQSLIKTYNDFVSTKP